MVNHNEVVSIILIDFSPHTIHHGTHEKSYNFDLFHQQIRWLKSKLLKIDKRFSMNLDPIQSISYESLTNNSNVSDGNDFWDLKISFRLDCILLCWDKTIYVLDRKSKQVLRRIMLDSNYINSLINDDHGEIYLVVNHAKVIKYRLREFVFGENPVPVWEILVDDACWGFTLFDLDGMSVLILAEYGASRCIRCEDGRIMEANIPNITNTSAVETTPQSELILCHSNYKLDVLKRIGTEWILLSSTSLKDFFGDDSSYNCYSLVYERASRNIYMSIPYGSVYDFVVLTQKGNDIKEGFKLVEKKKFGSTCGLCIDSKSGQLLSANSGGINIFE